MHVHVHLSVCCGFFPKLCKVQSMTEVKVWQAHFFKLSELLTFNMCAAASTYNHVPHKNYPSILGSKQSSHNNKVAVLTLLS